MDCLSAAVERHGSLLDHPRMIELLADRRRFFSYAWTAFLGVAVLLFGCSAFAPGVLAARLGSGLSWGFVLGVGYIGLIFGLTICYARRARHWDVLIGELRIDAGLDQVTLGSDR